MAEHRRQGVRVAGIFSEGVIMRDRFRLRVDDKFVGIAAASLAIECRSPLAKNTFQFFLWHGRDLIDGFNAEGAKRAFRDFADAGNFSHWQVREKSLFAACRDPDEAARLGLIRRNFCNEPSRSQSARTGKSSGASDRLKQLVGRGEWWSVQSLGAGEIEIGFIDRDHFDDGREFRENARDAVAPLRIFFVVAIQKNRVRAEPSRRSQRHRGVNSEFPRFIARGGNYTALIRATADNHGLAAKLRPFQQFHRNEKRVHVHMEDGRLREGRLILDWAVLGSEAREVRHALSLLSPQACNNSDLAVSVELEWIR